MNPQKTAKGGPRVVITPAVLQMTPEYILREARLRFEEIAEAVLGIPEDSAFWESARESRLCLVVHGWSFFYSFESGMLRVTDARK
ncbi:MAG TPA: hypothetical protein VMK66_07845 [Myxococcales bacterium]|nr:hypothetical protein [Myxococcales bacterium]